MDRLLSLDGPWQTIFDHDNKGRTCHWQHQENFERYHEIEPVTVPACLEEFKQDYEGVAWCGKTFDLPDGWQDKIIRLHFEAVNYRAEVWVNGEPAGAHEGGYTGFDLEIGDLLQAEHNFLAVRVITPLITRDVVIDGLGRDDMPHWRGAIAGGIWQPVWLMASDAVYVEDIFVAGDVKSGDATMEMTLHNTGLRVQEVSLQWAVSAVGNDGSPVAAHAETVDLRPGNSRLERTLTVPDFKLWQLDDPRLYRLTARVLIQDELSDQIETRFGFREFSVEGRHFILNGEKIVLKTTFNEAFYPHSLAYPRDLDLLREEFRLIKAANINMIRPWRKPQPRVVYDLADEMGILFVGALPVECMRNWPQMTPYTQMRIENEVAEMVQRDRNHPSIVIWEMFNEILRLGLKRLRHRASLTARALDTTRVIIDEAGGFAGVCSLYLPGSYEPMEINDVHLYPGMPLEQERYDELLLLGKSEEDLKAMGLESGPEMRSQTVPGLLTNLSELGYGSIPDLVDNLARYQREGNPLAPDYRMHVRLHDSYQAIFEQMNLSRVFPTFHDFVLAVQEIHYTGNKLMAEACRINPDVAGIGIHALNDGDWIIGAGLIDNFRQPKRAYYAIQEIFAERYIAIRPSRQNVYAGEDVWVRLTSVNDKAALHGTLSLRVIAADGQALLDVQEEMALPAGIVDLNEYGISTAGLTGKCQIDVIFRSRDADRVTNRTSFYILERSQSSLPQQNTAIIDIDGELCGYLTANGVNASRFSPQTPHQEPVLVNLNGWDGDALPIFADVADWVEAGGTAIFLNTPPEEMLAETEQGNLWRFLPGGQVFPFDITYFSGRGLWTPCSHVVPDHPVYAGLPSNCLMGQEYRDVVSRWSMVTPKTEWISGNLTYDWYPGLDHKQNFLGVSAALHGADLTQLSHGDGCFILCTHRLVENLGSDPVAERLFSNLLRWAVSG